LSAAVAEYVTNAEMTLNPQLVALLEIPHSKLRDKFKDWVCILKLPVCLYFVL
jgi:hypothetical protein